MDDFNAKFAGKTVADGHTFPTPRPSRPVNSIEIQRHRIKNLELTNAEGSKMTLSTIKDFKLKHQPAHPESSSSEEDEKDDDHANEEHRGA
jgi:hypothetical protein